MHVEDVFDLKIIGGWSFQFGAKVAYLLDFVCSGAVVNPVTSPEALSPTGCICWLANRGRTGSILPGERSEQLK